MYLAGNSVDMTGTLDILLHTYYWRPIFYLWQELRVHNIVDFVAKVANVRHRDAPEKHRDQTVILLFNDCTVLHFIKLLSSLVIHHFHIIFFR